MTEQAVNSYLIAVMNLKESNFFIFLLKISFNLFLKDIFSFLNDFFMIVFCLYFFMILANNFHIFNHHLNFGCKDH